VCARVGNQRSRGVVIVRLQSSLQSLLHQRRDLHQSAYLYLTEDQKPISHQPASSSMRHCMVLPPDAGCTSYTYVAEHAATRPPSTLALQERRSSRPRLTSIAAPHYWRGGHQHATPRPPISIGTPLTKVSVLELHPSCSGILNVDYRENCLG
jgi:hypothetical protein